MDTAIHDQLGSNERVQEKIEKIKQFAREIPVSSDDEAQVQGLSDALSVSQTRESKLHQRAEVKQACPCGYNQPFHAAILLAITLLHDLWHYFSLQPWYHKSGFDCEIILMSLIANYEHF